ncbi:MAG: hypothetical protein K9J16_13850 [Melioribacteraceae bacterium]|nr:hypothetical protein [Melioribacteraceae bacterium]MCF8355496.1 hypothetical protein [Melioribacteraceae bacterium]MCF8394921.1 hypothetical protein [Melioribacteraceae bacterium]MCF8420437.1 hypothetical protein [Melioribacteraceae bacterium]
MLQKSVRISLMILQIFSGLSGLFGGLILIIDPTGNSIQLKSEWLNATPFADFLIPGIILFIFIGVGHIFGFIITIIKHKLRFVIALVLGCILISWIAFQVGLIGYKNFLQPLYFIVGLLEVLLSITYKRAVND